MDEAFKRVPAELVYEDYNSSLWFGSERGLFLYDGIEFYPFQKEDSTSDHVRSIFRDSKKRLWVGYESGGIYHLEQQKLQRWEPGKTIPDVPVNSFAEDDLGNIWISTNGGGVFVFDNSTIHRFSAKDGLPSNRILSMAKGKHGQVWLGSAGGLTGCSFAEGKKEIENYPLEHSLTDTSVSAILVDEDGRLWMGTSSGSIYQFDPQAKSFSPPMYDQKMGSVSCLEIFEGTELWVGTEGNGIWRYALTSQTLSQLPDFEQSIVTDLLRDIEGNIWAVTSSHGIRSANRQFESIPTDFQDVQAILCDSKNHLWIGTSEGLSKYERGAGNDGHSKSQLPHLELNVLSLYEDEFGNIWIGTLDNGVYVYAPNTEAIHHFTEGQGLSDDNVISIAGSEGRVWLATLGGATKIEFESNIFSETQPSFQILDQDDGLGTSFIYKVFIDQRGRTWFGTNGHGISVLENGKLKNFPTAEHVHVEGGSEEDIRLSAVYSITEDKNGHIWFSSENAGIFQFDGEAFFHLDLKEGIRDLEITSLTTNANGQILIVHPSGVDVLIPESKHLIYYDDEVGIGDFAPKMNAVSTDRFGNIWIGGKNTIIKYTALKEDLEIHPRTSLSNVSVLLEPIDFANKKIFSYDENYLAFSYMGLWYTDPEIVKYRYQLIGYDLDWIESKDRRATYSNLRPGKYTFRVTSTENDAWADEPVVSYSFKIKSPIWMRWWFFALLLPALLGLFRLYQRNRDRRIQLVNLMEKDKAENKLATLKAQINPHFLFNSFNTLISVVEKTPELAVEYIENLSDFYRKIMQLRDKDIIPVDEEIELLNNYTYLLKKRYGNNFNLDIDLPEEEWFIVPLTLQLLVENAVKHNIISKRKPLTVSIRAEGAEYITVTNNLQTKLTQEKSTYFGLHSLIQRYDFLNKKKVKVEKDEKVFKVSIPIIS